MTFLDELTPRRQARAFIALAHVLAPPKPLKQSEERKERDFGAEPSPAEAYAQLVTHGATVAGDLWWLAIPLAARLAEENASMDSGELLLDFHALTAALGDPLAECTARLAGFRPYECPHRGRIWGRHGTKPRLGVTSFSIGADWLADVLDDAKEQFEARACASERCERG